MRIPKHVSCLLISLWEPAYSLYVGDKYVTPTGKRLHAGYVHKAEARVCVSVGVNLPVLERKIIYYHELFVVNGISLETTYLYVTSLNIVRYHDFNGTSMDL